MEKINQTNIIKPYDDRRNIAVPGNSNVTTEYCINHFIETAKKCIQDRGYFAVALSGGSTPKAIFKGLARKENHDIIDWSRVLLFWSDERCVSPNSPESNYHMAMEAGFTHLPIPLENIHRMKAEEDPENNAIAYEQLMEEKLNGEPFDLVMLGMGNDGHTASLFPKTHGLHAPEKKVIANFLPQMDVWRMTLTYECINAAREIVIYVLGESKAEMVNKVFTGSYLPDEFPIQRIGTQNHKALWILDEAAAKLL
ncbi:MAG: 6-phosphogluconolactonase [Chlamydiota bacterium]|nr:6-phosphogluconolactonase [Chlamydiota bacterium]